jgi:hypothetical protein
MRLSSALIPLLCLCFVACSPPLEEELDPGEAIPDHGRYLARLREPIPGELTPSVRDQAVELTSRYGGTLLHVYETSFRGFAVADLPEAQAQALSYDPAVARLERDTQVLVRGGAPARSEQ